MTDPSLYSISVRKVTLEKEATFQASVMEFPHVKAYGDTASEAYETALSFVTDLVKQAESSKKFVPAPHQAIEDYSGRITLRMPKTMHRLAATFANESAISLNQYIVNAVAYYTGVVERASAANVWPAFRAAPSSTYGSKFWYISTADGDNAVRARISDVPPSPSLVFKVFETSTYAEWPESIESSKTVPFNLLIHGPQKSQ